MSRFELTKEDTSLARIIGKLTTAKINSLREPGLYGDGGGLSLRIGPMKQVNGHAVAGSRSWVLRYMVDGKAREMGLGPLHTVGLADARAKALAARQRIVDGIDPLEVRARERTARRLEAANAITFKEVAERYIEAHRAGWKNKVHAAQWPSSLEAYVYASIGSLAVAAIDTGHVTKILEPIWTVKTVTAARLRGRIEAVLSYATTHGWRSGPNPAAWRGHLQNVLPAPSKVAQSAHHAALPWQQVGDFMARIEGQDGVAALALRFLILTAARTGEVIGATWREIEGDVWIVPAARMKAGKEHRVPLSKAALAVLKEADKLRTVDRDSYLFPGRSDGQPLSNMALLQLLRRMGRGGDLTAHGFRSTFRDWCAETGKPSDIAEAALAHVSGDKTVIAYQRGDMLARRRRLMEQWSNYCATPSRKDARIIPLHA
jgi:integrase